MPENGEGRVIYRARAVVPMEVAPIDNGAVVVEDGRVIDLGPFDEITARNSGEVVDLGERALLPGLINAHCHLDYTNLRGKIAPQKSFADWIRAINSEKARLTPGDYVKSIDAGFAEARRFGTTTVVVYEAFTDLIMRAQKTIRAWWFAELINVRDPNLPEKLVDLAMLNTAAAKHRGLAPHAPFTASLDVYRYAQQTARDHDLLLSTHLAESAEEMQMFREASGPLHDFLAECGRDMRDCGGQTPFGFLSQQIALDQRWILVHLNELSAEDFARLGRSTSKFSIVHCPRSHKYFGHSPFQFERLRELGYNICLGTDSLASNDDLSMFAEMRAFAKAFPTVSAQEILEMATRNPARALKQTDRIGKIARGADVDLIAVPFRGGEVYEQIIAFGGEPWLTPRPA